MSIGQYWAQTSLPALRQAFSEKSWHEVQSVFLQTEPLWMLERKDLQVARNGIVFVGLAVMGASPVVHLSFE